MIIQKQIKAEFEKRLDVERQEREKETQMMRQQHEQIRHELEAKIRSEREKFEAQIKTYQLEFQKREINKQVSQDPKLSYDISQFMDVIADINEQIIF